MTENSSIISEYRDTHFGKYEFIKDLPELAIPCIVLLIIASVVGTIGNILILLVVWKTKELRQIQSIFIVNLALSDMYVTLIADPMSIIGKIEGREFFDKHPILCTMVGKLCTISCISSLGSIAFLSLNRYVYICHNQVYKKAYNRWTCLLMCVSLYCVGLVLVLLNIAGIGDHSFDDKSLECIWDRQATYSYTVVFSVGLVWIPLLVVGMSYFRLFTYVRMKRKRVEQDESRSAMNSTHHPLKLARTIFVVYAIFSICWIPFAILLVADVEDTFPHEVHLCITVFAHFHPSINWLIYYLTNGKFKVGFNRLLKIQSSTIDISHQGKHRREMSSNSAYTKPKSAKHVLTVHETDGV